MDLPSSGGLNICLGERRGMDWAEMVARGQPHYLIDSRESSWLLAEVIAVMESLVSLREALS